jgi:hypothetical protein
MRLLQWTRGGVLGGVAAAAIAARLLSSRTANAPRRLITALEGPARSRVEGNGPRTDPIEFK